MIQKTSGCCKYVHENFDFLNSSRKLKIERWADLKGEIFSLARVPSKVNIIGPSSYKKSLANKHIVSQCLNLYPKASVKV